MMIDVSSTMVGWQALVPALVVTLTALVVMSIDLVLAEDSDRSLLAALGISGLVIAVGTVVWLWGGASFDGFDGRIRADRFGLGTAALICGAAAFTLLLSVEYVREQAIAEGDYYVLVLLATAGMMVMATASDLLVVFLALEIMSVAVYVLAGMLREDPRSIEASLKYFLLGAFASGFLLYGIAFFFGSLGSTRIDALAEASSVAPGSAGMLRLGLGLLLVGLGFKVALMPFHAWTPDVYEGAPTPITTFMAVGVKAASFAVLARVFGVLLGAELSELWRPVLWTLAVLTMTVGNVTALAQESVKRMLAYSSIAHAGYALIGVVVGSAAGLGALLFYLVAYGIMNVGAFGVLLALGRRGDRGERYEDFAGVGLRHPALGAAMALFMLSLAGIPLTAGFAGKFQLFAVAIDAGYVWLAVIAILNSLISVYYYLGLIVQMYMTEGSRPLVPLRKRPALATAIWLAALGTLALGVVPGWPLALARAAGIG